MTLDVNHIMGLISSIGRHQLIILVNMFYIILMADMMMNYVVIFSASESAWRCLNTSSLCNLTGTYTEGMSHYEYRCTIPRQDWEFVNEYSSFVTEWDLVCESSVFGPIAQSVQFMGWLAGSLLFGTVSEQLGRKRLVYISSLIVLLVGIIESFSPFYWFFVLCRFLIGMGIGGSLFGILVFCVEISDIRRRGTSGGTLFFCSGMADMILAFIAYLLQEWRQLHLAVAMTGLPGLCSWWCVSESPKLLLHTVTQSPRSHRGEMLSEHMRTGARGQLIDLFSTRQRTRTTIVLFILWLTLSLVSYGTAFAISKMSGSMYLNFFILGLFVFPFQSFDIWFIGKIGRRHGLSLGLMGAAVAAYTCLYIPRQTESAVVMAAHVSLFILIRWGCSLAWCGIYVFSWESFPLDVRSVGMTWCSMISRLGAFLSPYIVWLGHINEYLPMGVLGSSAMITSVLIMFQDETDEAPPDEFIIEAAPSNQKHKPSYQVKEAFVVNSYLSVV